MSDAIKFSFNDKNLKKIEEIILRYPRKRSAVIEALYLAQEQEGYVHKDAIDAIAKFLEIQPAQVYEVASFYSMINTKPIGGNHIQICRTTSCWLMGCSKLTEVAKKKLGIKNLGDISQDGKFTVSEVECLGACRNAPVVQINNDYHEEVNASKLIKIIEEIQEDSN